MKFYIAYLNKVPHYGTYAEKEIPGSKEIYPDVPGSLIRRQKWQVRFLLLEF